MACYLIVVQDQSTDTVLAYYVTELLLFRPFLLLCLELKRRGVNDILRESNGRVEMAEVYEAAANSVAAATNIIDFCKALFTLNVGVEVRTSVGDTFPGVVSSNRSRVYITMHSTLKAHVLFSASLLCTVVVFRPTVSTMSIQAYNCYDNWEHGNLFGVLVLRLSR